MYLDRNKKKAIATHIQSHRKHEYEIFDAGSDVLIQLTQSQIDWKVKIEFGRPSIPNCFHNRYDLKGRTEKRFQGAIYG